MDHPKVASLQYIPFEFQDLEDMGIVRLGHQKKILLAIKRVKDIRAGKRSISNQGSLDFTRLQQVCTRNNRVAINVVMSRSSHRYFVKPT